MSSGSYLDKQAKSNTDEYKNLKFHVDRLKQDMQVMSALMTDGRLDRLEDSLKNLKVMQFSIDTLRVQFSNCINK